MPKNIKKLILILALMSLAQAPAEAGEVKRRLLLSLRALVLPCRIVGLTLVVTADVIEENLDRIIQRDLDRQNYEKMKAEEEAHATNSDVTEQQGSEPLERVREAGSERPQ